MVAFDCLLAYSMNILLALPKVFPSLTPPNFGKYLLFRLVSIPLIVSV